MKHLKICITTIVLLIALSFTASATAPLVYLESTVDKAAPGTDFTVTIFVQSNGTSFNAFDFNLAYDPDVLEFTGYSNAGSISGIWQKNPEDSAGNIVFSGGLLESYAGENGKIVELNFKTLREGTARFSFRKSDLYLADGKGTLLRAGSRAESVEVIPGLIPENKTVVHEDETAPEIAAEVFKNPLEDNLLVYFNAGDLESGVKTAMMRSKKWFFWSDFTATQNPFLLPKGAWAVEVKVMNNNGGEASKILYFWSELWKKIGFFGGGLLLLTILAKVIYNNRKRNNDFH